MTAVDAAPLASTSTSSGENCSLRDWLNRGPFCLCLSSSFFGFYFHAGVLRTLHEAGFAPSRVCGSSAGSVVASLYAGGLCPATSLPALLLQIRRGDIIRPFWFAPSCLWRGGFAKINESFLRKHAPAIQSCIAQEILPPSSLPRALFHGCSSR